MNRRYSELIAIPSIIGRYDYCRLSSKIGNPTFSGHRALNQSLYRSNEWKDFRREILIRDNGCEFGLLDYPIFDRPIIHHLNPLSIQMIYERDKSIFDPENVICVSLLTHEAIHYGDKSLLPKDYVERSQNDTCPWK